MDKWIYLITGGVLGTCARYGLTALVTARTGFNFPFGTLAVNLIGCFLVGFFDILAERKFNAHPQMRILLVTGFCGAFTTFSAFILENYSLMRAGDLMPALINIAGSITAGLILFKLGMVLGEAIL